MERGMIFTLKQLNLYGEIEFPNNIIIIHSLELNFDGRLHKPITITNIM